MNAKLIIDNKYIDSISTQTIEQHSPWDGSIIGTNVSATLDEANLAVDSSYNAFKTWKLAPLSQKIDILTKAHDILRSRVDELTLLLHKEIAKTEEDARSEIIRSLEYLELTITASRFIKGKMFYGDMFSKYPKNRKTGYYKREPLGVVLAISPFNYPINLSITKIAPALITGNTVVFKPATKGALTAFEFYKAFIEAGLPPGVLNFITGSSSVIGDALLSNRKVALIAFTGSSGVGNHIKDIAYGIPLLLELGGKDNAIVTSNADLDLASKEIVSGAFSYSGQRCTAQKLVIAFSSIAEELKSRIVELTKQQKLGPMIDSASVDYVLELINDATSKGAELVLKGERNNNLLGCNVLNLIRDDMRIYKEEQFGPALPIMVVIDENEAILKANASLYGLQASVYTKDIEEAYRIAEKLEVGTVQINGKGDRGPDNFPFGGVKDSGQMMQGLEDSLELMTRGKLIVLNLHKQ